MDIRKSEIDSIKVELEAQFGKIEEVLLNDGEIFGIVSDHGIALPHLYGGDNFQKRLGIRRNSLPDYRTFTLVIADKQKDGSLENYNVYDIRGNNEKLNELERPYFELCLKNEKILTYEEVEDIYRKDAGNIENNENIGEDTSKNETDETSASKNETNETDAGDVSVDKDSVSVDKDDANVDKNGADDKDRNISGNDVNTEETDVKNEDTKTETEEHVIEKTETENLKAEKTEVENLEAKDIKVEDKEDEHAAVETEEHAAIETNEHATEEGTDKQATTDGTEEHAVEKQEREYNGEIPTELLFNPKGNDEMNKRQKKKLEKKKAESKVAETVKKTDAKAADTVTEDKVTETVKKAEEVAVEQQIEDTKPAGDVTLIESEEEVLKKLAGKFKKGKNTEKLVAAECGGSICVGEIYPIKKGPAMKIKMFGNQYECIKKVVDNSDIVVALITVQDEALEKYVASIGFKQYGGTGSKKNFSREWNNK